MKRCSGFFWSSVALTSTMGGCIVPDQFVVSAGGQAGQIGQAGASGSSTGYSGPVGARAGEAGSSTGGARPNGNAGNGTSTGGASVVGVPTGGGQTAGGVGGTAMGGQGAGGTASGGTTTGGTATGGTATGGTTADAATAGTAAGGTTAPGSSAGGTPPTLLQDCRVLLHLDEDVWNGSPDEVKDDSGWQHHGTAVGSINTLAFPAKFRRAGRFNDNGYIDLGDEESLRPRTALTMSAWFYITELDGIARGILAKRAGWNDRSSYGIFIMGGDTFDPTQTLIYVDVDDSNNRFSSDPSRPLVAGTWYHVAVVYDGNLAQEQRVSLYVNGLLDGGARHETSSAIPDYNGPLHVGDLREGGYYFRGFIDEVAIWHRALAPSEVTTLYWAGVPLE